MRKTADHLTTVDLQLHTRFSDGDDIPERHVTVNAADPLAIVDGLETARVRR